MDDDMTFLNEFRTGTLPFEQWTHTAHIRMAYLTCKLSNSFDEALLTIRNGIKHFNGLHESKLTVGFHETMTQLWTILIWNATKSQNSIESDSKTFINNNSHLLNSSLWKEYYSSELMFSSDAKKNFIQPDLKSVSVNT